METQNQKQKQTINILHFNDCHEMEARLKNGMELGGGSKFAGIITDYKIMLQTLHPDQITLTLFSGDAFSPCSISEQTEGEISVQVLNACMVDAACYGNHEFDFPMAQVIKLKNKCNFEWLLSNVKSIDHISNDEVNFGDGKEFIILEQQSFRVGVFGLAEKEWLGQILCDGDKQVLNNIRYEDFVECANRLSLFLKKEKACDLVVALTHMRSYNDKLLAERVPSVDAILGGHDHVKICQKINSSLIVKSGCDFAGFHHIQLEVQNIQSNQNITQQEDGLNLHNNNNNNNNMNNMNIIPPLQFEHFQIVKADYIESNDAYKIQSPASQQIETTLKSAIAEEVSKLKHSINQTILYSQTELETRFNLIRTQQCNAGSFIADCIRLVTETDICLVNSGTLRANTLFEKGFLTQKDLLQILPITDQVWVLQVTGDVVMAALENSVCMHPALDGRFCQVSGLCFKYDPALPAFHRILPEDVFMESTSKPIVLNEKYTISCKKWIAVGKDGFNCFKEEHKIFPRHEKEIISVSDLLIDLFERSELDETFKRIKIQCINQGIGRQWKEQSIFCGSKIIGNQESQINDNRVKCINYAQIQDRIQHTNIKI